MALKFKKGDAVRQVVPAPVEGVITGQAIVDDEVQYSVQWTGPDGDSHERFFTEDQLTQA